MRYHLTPKSANAKTGPIPVSTTSQESCPPSCPFAGTGCYAESGPLAIHWRQVTDGRRGNTWYEFLDKVREIPAGQLWRHNQAGDLPGDGEAIDRQRVRELALASRHARGFTYTHYRATPANIETARQARELGFSILFSTESDAQADDVPSDIGVAVAMPENRGTHETAGGRRVYLCPAQAGDSTCATCGLCWYVQRAWDNPRPIPAIGFQAHGARKASLPVI